MWNRQMLVQFVLSPSHLPHKQVGFVLIKWQVFKCHWYKCISYHTQFHSFLYVMCSSIVSTSDWYVFLWNICISKHCWCMHIEHSFVLASVYKKIKEWIYILWICKRISLHQCLRTRALITWFVSLVIFLKTVIF